MADSDHRARHFKGLINAVLRRLSEAAPGEEAPEGLVPPWMWARWRAAYGDQAAAIAALIAQEPPTDVTLKDAAGAAALAQSLQATVLPGGSLRVGLKGEVSGWPEFSDGAWWVQDAAAAIPARLLNVQPGQTVLDMCAAPGGKSLLIGDTIKTGKVVAEAGAKITPRLARKLADQGLNRRLELTAGLNAAKALFQLLLPEQLHGGRAVDAGLEGNLLVGFDVDLNTLHGTGQLIDHPLQLGLQYMAGATGGGGVNHQQRLGAVVIKLAQGVAAPLPKGIGIKIVFRGGGRFHW
jgi:hypothetical protein